MIPRRGGPRYVLRAGPSLPTARMPGRMGSPYRTALLVGRAPGRKSGPGAVMPTTTLARPLDLPAPSGLPQIDPIALAPRADACDALSGFRA